MWARLLVVAGALLMLGPGAAFALKDAVFGYATRSVHQEDLLPVEAGKHATVTGAKNMLNHPGIVGSS